MAQKKPSAEFDPNSLPAGLAAPARRALAQAGWLSLDELSKHSEAELLQLHGMGPKALESLRRALAENGLSFSGQPKK